MHEHAAARRVVADRVLSKTHRYIVLTAGGIEQDLVEANACNRINLLVAVLPIAHEIGRSVKMMHQSTLHRHEQGLDGRVDAGVLQCVAATRGQSKVDRPAGLGIVDTRIGLAFVQVHRKTVACQQESQLCAALTCTDDIDGMISHDAGAGGRDPAGSDGS